MGGLTPTPHTAAVEGELFWWHSIQQAILIAQAGPGTAGYWVEQLNGQDFPASSELPRRQRHHIRHADFHAMLDSHKLIWLPKPGALAVGLPTPVIAEGELFWWHSLGQAVRVVDLTGGVYGAGVNLERLDGGEFPAQGDTPASRRCHIPLAEFNTLLETHDLVWLPAPEKAEPSAAESPPAEAVPTPASPRPSLAEFWLQLGELREYESIRAHPAGANAAAISPDGFAEIRHVYLNSKPYRLVGLTGSRVIALNPNEEYDFVRVEGNSMNAAKPEPINEGDYVLVRQVVNADPGAIVAANIVDPTTGDHHATLKRFRKDGLYSESTEAYPVVHPELIESLWGEVIAVAKPERNGDTAGAPA
jgi:peptidase S24-like protein